MKTGSGQSTLEMLPDEILLEVCKYLLCGNILQSFVELNCRMTQMITQYRHHVSLNKTYISTFDYLCVNVLPQIGSQVQSLVMNRSYSVVQDQLFINYFGKKMPIIFPKLERISLVSYRYDRLIAFLDTLHDLDYLIEIRLYSLFSVQSSDQPTLVRSLARANNHRFTTILIDDRSSCLSFDDTDRYSTVHELRINLRSIVDLPALFAAVPNVRYLDVVIKVEGDFLKSFEERNFSSLQHLTNFRLKSIIHRWKLEELVLLLIHLPIVQHLSMFLSTRDRRLIESDKLFPSLPSTIQQLNYAVHLFSTNLFDRANEILVSWPPSHPITCFFNDQFIFLHTLPWHFPHMELFSLYSNQISSCANNVSDYDRNVEQLDVWIDRTFTSRKSLARISQCRRVRQITIDMENDGDAVKEEEVPISCLPKLSRLLGIRFYGTIPSDLNHFSFILNIASNLFRLDLPFDYLLKLIEDPQTCHILGLRITSLNINKNETSPSLITINEEHIRIIASIFPRILDLYVDFTHLSCSTRIVSNENIVKDSTTENLSVQSCEQKYGGVLPSSSESMLRCLLTEFKEHRLISLCIDGHFFEELKTYTEQWLRDNTILHEQQFKAVFNSEMNRLLIWM